jgi:hypothetical protein
MRQLKLQLRSAVIKSHFFNLSRAPFRRVCNDVVKMTQLLHTESFQLILNWIMIGIKGITVLNLLNNKRKLADLTLLNNIHESKNSYACSTLRNAKSIFI